MTATAVQPTDKPQLIITPDQYRALQYPVQLPTPQELFDFQVKTLVANGLAKYEHADPFRKNLPKSGLFLLVPPRPKKLDLPHLMILVTFKGKTGVNHLNVKDLTDKVNVPDGPYLMLDVEDGYSRRKIKPSVSEVYILEEGRSPLTTFEGIVHAVLFPSVFETNNMDLCGSRYGSEFVPYVSLYDEKPMLVARLRDDAVPKWGAPSCGSRVGA